MRLNKHGQLVIADMTKSFCKTHQKIVLPELSSEMDSIEKFIVGNRLVLLSFIMEMCLSLGIT